MSETILKLDGVVKEFPGVRALDGVHLEVRAGEVHCLLGQNGAGKSTLIKVLAGVHKPDAGTVIWQGSPVGFANPQAAMKAGIATIYQELDLVDHLSVAENVFLGQEPSRFGFVHRRTAATRTREVLRRLGHPEIPVHRLVEALPSAGKQIVSMARALSHEAKLLIMDEPSAVLAHDEVGNLFRIIRELTAEGIAVVYISHRLEEIREIGDRVTVLKDGRTSAVDLPARTTPTRDLVSKMTGRSIEYVFPPREGDGRGPHVGAPAAATGGLPSGAIEQPLLEVRRLSRAHEFQDVSFEVRAGEIVGIAGLVGSGRSELLETVYGARTPESGTVTVAGRKLPAGDVGAAVKAGLGLAPEERKSQALLLAEPVYRNITLTTFGRYAHGGFTDAGREQAEASRIADALELRPRDVRRPAGTLSGGNQQKVVVGRWLLGDTRLLLLDEPTRGVDVGARAELYQVIRDLARRGVGVLLVSSEVPEVLGLADRVLVMREGRLIKQAPAGELTEDDVLDLVMAGSLSPTSS
ncbi:MAG: sugar ABC transporter ATP-binding protein [Hamadaea sp.]|nr:sugar ABC transporter ATP-binding protein [Hamadaea sp.]NUR50055.1 sugar ABC transporter ATP-binding protein [Hamadaea sp.]